MLGKGSDEKQHEAAHDMRGTCHSGWEKSGTSGTLEEGKGSLRDEWEKMAQSPEPCLWDKHLPFCPQTGKRALSHLFQG